MSEKASDFLWHDVTEWFQMPGRRFCVRTAKTYIRQHPDWEVNEYDVTSLIPMAQFFGVSRSRLEKRWAEIDLDDPIVVVTTNVGGEVVQMPIDGWHRIAKAGAEGENTLRAIVLDERFSNAVECG